MALDRRGAGVEVVRHPLGGQALRHEAAGRQVAAPAVLGEAKECPRPLAEALDKAGLGQELQVARNAGLRLPKDVGEVGDGQLGLGQHRRLADHVDVALIELPVPAALRPVRPPHRSHLQRPERHRQRRVVVPVEPGQRHGQVVAQAQVDELAQRRAGRHLRRQPAPQHLEDQLLVVAALAAAQPVDVLQRRRLDPLVAEPPVHRGDRLEHMITDSDVSGQQVPHSPGRTVVDLHEAFP